LRADGRLPFILVLVAQPVTSNKRVVDMKAMAAFFLSVVFILVDCPHIFVLPLSPYLLNYSVPQDSALIKSAQLAK
jgi:hypothetical protein